MKILITGGTTFVSEYAAEYFVAKGNDITVINRGSRPQVDGVTHTNCDRTTLGDRLGRLTVKWYLDNESTTVMSLSTI